MICYFLLQFIPHYYKFFGDKGDDSNIAAIKGFFQRLNDTVKSHPGGYMSEGDSPTAVDYLIWPWLERYGALKILVPGRLLLIMWYVRSAMHAPLCPSPLDSRCFNIYLLILVSLPHLPYCVFNLLATPLFSL